MDTSNIEHENFMRQAINEAHKALDRGEVPIGAVIVCNGLIIGKGYNMVETLGDATAHAEILAITAATEAVGAKYLKDCTLYVTVEPCIMCAGACYWSQVGGVVFGAGDEKKGYRTVTQNILHPKTSVISGVLEKECEMLMKCFFAKLRI